MLDLSKTLVPHESCDGCYNNLGGLYNFCAINSEKECQAGGGFELYSQRKCAVCGEELHYPQCVTCSKCAPGMQEFENAMQQLAAAAEPTRIVDIADLPQHPISDAAPEDSKFQFRNRAERRADKRKKPNPKGCGGRIGGPKHV